MSDLNVILEKLPAYIRIPIETLPDNIKRTIEEIRLQINQPIRIISGNREITVETGNTGVLDKSTMEILLNNLLDYSIYAYENELIKGYITIEGGHRVGVCGRAVLNNDKTVLIKDISSVNIRRSREIKNTAVKIIDKLYSDKGGLQNTIIVSPPKCGKTTLLRDIVRLVSNSGLRVAVCDERSEIAGMYQGVPSYDLGPRTDVLDGFNKADGMLMLIRSMAPDVIVTDEIGKSADIDALETALLTGVKVITTIHGRDYNDLINSKVGALVLKKVFSRVIILSNIPSTGTIKEVIYV